MIEQTQGVDVLIDKYMSENNVQTDYDKEKPAFLDSVIDDYLKKSGYEIPGEIPKERPVPYPEGTYPGVTPPPKGTYIGPVRDIAEKERMEKIGMTAGTEDWLPKIPVWQQIKDLAVATATGKINPGEHLWDDAIRGLSFGNIQDPLGLIEKISGKTGFKASVEARQTREIEAATGKKAAQYKEAIRVGETAASALGSMLTFVPVIRGASIPAKMISSIPAVQAGVRAGLMGIFTGLATKPEDDSIWNRVKQVPKEVLIWGALETGFMTASEIAKIINYNMKVPKGMRGKWGTWEEVPPIKPGTPGEVKFKEFTAQDVIEIKRKMDVNATTPGTFKFDPFEEQAMNHFMDLKAGGWKNWKQGFKTQPIEVPGEPAVYPTAAYGEVAPIPRQPKFTDIFRKGPLPQFEETFKAKWPEGVPESKISPEAARATAAPPPVVPPTVEPEKAPPRAAEAQGQPSGAPPQVVLDVTPKVGGGWTYTFKPGIAEAVPASAVESISPETLKGLPPHIQEIIKTKMPRTWAPRKRRTFADPLVDEIYKLGGISPDNAFPMEVLKDLGLPVGVINKNGFHLDVLAQTLMANHPELDTPRVPPDQALYNLIFQRVIRARHGKPTAGEGEESPLTAEEARSDLEDYYAERWFEGKLNREDLDPNEATLIQELKDKKRISGANFGTGKLREVGGVTVGEFEGKGYQGADKEAIKEEYRKWLISEGVSPAAANKQLALFGGEFAPPEEIPKIPKAKVVEEPVLIEMPKREKSIFDSRGLGSFKDINVWRKQIQPFVEQGYVVEYGHEGGTKGWARLIEKKKSGEGKLISRAIAIEGLPKGEALALEEPFAWMPKGTSAFDEYLAGLKDAELSDKELARHEGIIRDRAAFAKMTPDDYVVKYMTGLEKKVEPVAPKEVATVAKPASQKDVGERTVEILKKFKASIPEEKWGEITRRVLENYEEGDLVHFVRRTASFLDRETGEPLPKKGEPKGVSIEEIPERLRGEKEKAYGRFEMKQEEARLRDAVMKEAHDETDLDILENRFFKDPPESLEEIGTRHGISRQAVDKRLAKLMENLKRNPGLLEILNKKYELHSFPGMVSGKDIKDLRNFINKYLRSSKGVSKEVDMENDERIGGILAEKFGATVEGKKLSKYIKEQGENPATLQYFKDLLEGGDIQASSLPEEIKRLLLSMRQRIDRLSDMIIANGGVPEKTKAVFEANKGRYLGKFYRLYEKQERARGKVVKKYWDPPEEVRDRFKAALKVQFPDTFGTYSEEELDNFLEGMVRETDFFTQGTKRTKKIPPEHYIHRIKLTPEYREFAGEIMDPRYLYLKTASEQGVMAYNGKMLKFLKDGYPDLWTDNLDKARRLGWQKSQLPSDWHSYGEMAGLYVHPDLNEYLRNEFFPSRSGMEHAIEKYIVNPFKWTKTIGSVPTHARNFLGNPMFSMLLRNSIWNPGNAGYYIKAAKIIIGREGKYAKEWEDLVRHGVTETQFWGAEIPRFYEELLRIDPADWPERLFDASVKRPMNKLSNLYNSEDAIYRIASHLKNIEHFKMTPKESVEEQNLGMTNYRKLPTAVEILRRYPVFGPFISFKANVVKIMSSQVERAIKDMGKQATRTKGVMRLFRWLAALSAPIVLQEISKKVFDIDDEQQKIIEKYLPEWRKHGIYFYWRNSKGEAKVFDFTYIYPVGDIWQGVKAASKLDMAGFKNSMSLFYHPILDLYSVLVQDRDPTWGTKLPGGFKEQIAKAITQVWMPASAPIPSLKALVHGDIRAGSLTPYQIKTLIDAWYGEAPIGKEPKKFTEELKNFLTGVRTFDLNPKQIMGSYLRSKRFEATDSMQEYRTWLKQNPNARDYEVKEKKATLLKRQKKIAEQIKQASIDYGILRKGGFALEPEKQ